MVRRMSTVIYSIVKNREPFDDMKVVFVTEHREIHAAVFGAALAEDKSA